MIRKLLFLGLLIGLVGGLWFLLDSDVAQSIPGLNNATSLVKDFYQSRIITPSDKQTSGEKLVLLDPTSTPQTHGVEDGLEPSNQERDVEEISDSRSSFSLRDFLQGYSQRRSDPFSFPQFEEESGEESGIDVRLLGVIYDHKNPRESVAVLEVAVIGSEIREDLDPAPSPDLDAIGLMRQDEIMSMLLADGGSSSDLGSSNNSSLEGPKSSISLVYASVGNWIGDYVVEMIHPTGVLLVRYEGEKITEQIEVSMN